MEEPRIMRVKVKKLKRSIRPREVIMKVELTIQIPKPPPHQLFADYDLIDWVKRVLEVGSGE